MAHIGRKLRELRLRSGLSLKDVEERSAALARDWGGDSYQISGSFLAEVELGKHEMTIPELVALSTIYCEPAEQLLSEFLPKLLRTLYPTPSDRLAPQESLMSFDLRFRTLAGLSAAIYPADYAVARFMP